MGSYLSTTTLHAQIAVSVPGRESEIKSVSKSRTIQPQKEYFAQRGSAVRAKNPAFLVGLPDHSKIFRCVVHAC